ncbi:hypothetical protein VITFI_CDS2863 [Vitreoscilla filiformis]|uniref:Uncharacterized protein n=1 Tax=Vitreoscilla filiformis TaxID=63 RepID=A0A221KIL1_VITFI|nr:hypothetical protein VITFI_CDS2863 [Vitreoscilla filiformis]
MICRHSRSPGGSMAFGLVGHVCSRRSATPNSTNPTLCDADKRTGKLLQWYHQLSSDDTACHARLKTAW